MNLFWQNWPKMGLNFSKAKYKVGSNRIVLFEPILTKHTFTIKKPAKKELK
jgi:hypothetical protein